MAAKKTYKKLTNKEKQARKEAREELRRTGVLPPAKPRLNRKKFAQEVTEEFTEFGSFSDSEYLFQAIGWMLPAGTTWESITSEQVGLLKTLKLAMEIKKFMEGKIDQGETTYSVQELFDSVVRPVLKL